MLKTENILNKILCGDALTLLKQMPDNFIDTVITSPPYWGLRDYGTAEWEGGDENCKHKHGNQVAQTNGVGNVHSGMKPGYDASVCIICGAKRIDEQIGLAKT